MKSLTKILTTGIILGLFGMSSAALIIIGTALYLSPNLPEVNQIRNIQLQIPLRVYTQDGRLISEFGEQRRSPIKFDEIPTALVDAVLAAEDDSFYKHNGVDIKGLARAFFELIKTGRIKTGGSTITMQVAKNFFLSRERTFLRKFNEILLALQLERKLSKQEIFELYANKIYLGHRSYGFGAASLVYYGAKLKALSTAQYAMIAGLPKAPSTYNPIINPSRAKARRDWILKRMRLLGKISDETYETSTNEPVMAKFHGLKPEVDAGYVAEMVRQEMLDKLGEQAYTKGYHVYTTIDSKLQAAAVKAVRQGLMEYSKRHGYRGVERHVETIDLENDPISGLPMWTKVLKKSRQIGPLTSALTLEIFEDNTKEKEDWYLLAGLKNGTRIKIYFEDINWARAYKSANLRGAAPKKISDVVKTGDIIRVYSEDLDIKDQRPDPDSPLKNLPEKKWILSQVPVAQSALVSIDPKDGRVRALMGGFDFQHSKFNRAIQGGRQAGSSFKPFIYGAALNKGLTPASIINDAPIVFNDKSLETSWRPENSSGTFFGPTRLRKALYKSRNLVSIRLLKQIGIKHTINYAASFGIPKAALPNNLSLALGSATLTPLQIATGYSALANGGFKTNPYFIQRITDNSGDVIYEHIPLIACPDAKDASCLQSEQLAPRVFDEREHFLIQDMLKDVVRRGTGRKALSLGRSDIAGKTGTTNEQLDAWFSGFHPKLVASVWVGFDKPSTLGAREYGGTAALPIWIKYMQEALKDLPEFHYPLPDQVVSVKIDPESGNRAPPNQKDAIFEYFRAENAPEEFSQSNPAIPKKSSDESKTIEALF